MSAVGKRENSGVPASPLSVYRAQGGLAARPRSCLIVAGRSQNGHEAWGRILQIALGLAALTFLFLKGEIMSLEFALKDGPQPDRSYRYPAPCAVHPHGDEARLDYLIKGWPAGAMGRSTKDACVFGGRAFSAMRFSRCSTVIKLCPMCCEE
jgi:hypothetical protein